MGRRRPVDVRFCRACTGTDHFVSIPPLSIFFSVVGIPSWCCQRCSLQAWGCLGVSTASLSPPSARKKKVNFSHTYTQRTTPSPGDGERGRGSSRLCYQQDGSGRRMAETKQQGIEGRLESERAPMRPLAHSLSNITLSRHCPYRRARTRTTGDGYR